MTAPHEGALADALKALGLFLLVLAIGGGSSWLVESCLPSPPWAPGLAAQLAFLSTSLVLMSLLRHSWCDFGFRLVRQGLLRASLLSLAVATAFAGITAFLLGGSSGGEGPSGLAEDPLVLALLSLLVAPICEEVFFRGLLQGYLALRGRKRLSIYMPAVLFSAVHVLPFSTSGPTVLMAILTGALLLGLIAGHLRAASGSLLHPVLAHFWFNLLGYAIRLLAG